MTIQELLNCSILEKEAMTDAQLEEYFKPVLNITRPELVIKERKASNTMKPSMSKVAEQLEFERRIQKAKELAASLGVKL